MNEVEIKKALEVVVENFMVQLRIIENKYNEKVKEQEHRIDELDAKEIQIDIEKQEFLKTYAVKEKDMQDKKEQYEMAMKDIDSEHKHLISLTNECNKQIKENEDLYVCIKEEKKAIGELLENTYKKQEQYSMKLQSLEIDFERLENKKKEIADRERIIKTRLAEIDKKEEEILAKQKELSDIEYSLKIKEKKINTEYKRLAIQ